jgi:hypothetical protein
MNVERELERAMRPRSPQPGFSKRVMARIEAEEVGERKATWRGWRAVAASLTLTLLLGGYMTERVVERVRGERAKKQVLLAMRIASEKVSAARHEVRAIGTQP